jgi:next-to-BRCA1 protein 1
VFERYSDSAASYVTLDPANTHVYKTLFRAAKAKLKLRLRATVSPDSAVSTFPPLNPLGIPVSFASAFPEFSRFGSETTLNNNGVSVPSSTPQVQPSLETLLIPTIPSTISMPTIVNGTGETPEARSAPQPTSQKRLSTRLSREGFFAELANISRQRELALRMKEPQPAPQASSWSVYCNNCDNPMADEHYHCNICDDGDFDLCDKCVNAGIHCPGESHWLIKRFVKEGQVISSTTERLSPRPETMPEPQQPEMPGAFTEPIEEKKAEIEDVGEEEYEPSRTCNSCVKGREKCDIYSVGE